MPIAIQAPTSNRIRALAETNPSLTEEQIARRVGVLPSTVKLALSRPGRVRKKSVAG